MKLKQLEGLLGGLQQFPHPKVELEQYPTGPHIASRMLYTDFLRSNVMDLRWRGQTIDTVIMNPPFGTRKKGADMNFLMVALKVASQAVYSLHETSTRDHVKRAALRDFNARSAEVLCELRFDVPQLYKFHKKGVDIAVDLWRFVPASPQSNGIWCRQ